MILNKFKKRIPKNKNLNRIKSSSKTVKYHFVIGSSKFLLKNEPLEEMLRERAQFLQREKKPITFWLVKSPKFLTSNQLSGMNQKLLEAGLAEVELTAIISLDQSFITWLKLRLQNVGEGSFITSEDVTSPLSSNV